MEPTSEIIAFSFAASLLTIMPGLDTALILRTAAINGPKHALLAGGGIVFGSMTWSLIAALGLGALLALSQAGRLEEPSVWRESGARSDHTSVGYVITGLILLFGEDLMGRSELHGHHAGAVRPSSQASR
jgi:hypothetical protein